ncbi:MULTISPECIES: hypothetical protein [Streptosporangium]|uniref:Uncharacterized protein n=1 Tax=Streptosporangium brasiliense TaxID=47480 RepID=A0ABT9RIE0_9ACTN|nr:hypothetical protein [Streptosporangium brasiliense]MDP9869058.1 hypothetical protein [Streptosporangium brasiliense]
MIWDCAVSDNDDARALLEEYYLLPDTADRGPRGFGRKSNGYGCGSF